jgi:hypothetical protein
MHERQAALGADGGHDARRGRVDGEGLVGPGLGRVDMGEGGRVENQVAVGGQNGRAHRLGILQVAVGAGQSDHVHALPDSGLHGGGDLAGFAELQDLHFRQEPGRPALGRQRSADRRP